MQSWTTCKIKTPSKSASSLRSKPKEVKLEQALERLRSRSSVKNKLKLQEEEEEEETCFRAANGDRSPSSPPLSTATPSSDQASDNLSISACNSSRTSTALQPPTTHNSQFFDTMIRSNGMPEKHQKEKVGDLQV